jgi:hypothetical protein
MTSMVWTSSLNLGFYRKLSLKVLIRHFQALQYEKSLDGSFPNTEITYRIVLKVPVTVASAEQSSSKMKIIKNYLRATVIQERLGGLAPLSIKKK